MASTMLTGDKRWAPSRKSGMTVLGKVPKPLNLPSQRSENHGLDPNVEIVPKGTLTWGSRPGSTVPNVWTSSALLSPNTDGSSGSPSHLDGRPSSGSGTRPSTAGSDKSHEPASNAWCPNLRPSSASGSFASNQSSVVTNRPRSAEARPSSAQLSRFAETPVDSTVAWGPKRTSERVGPASKSTVFTLEPTEFPTLGSDKTSESQIQRGHSSHGRPSSSSGTTAVHKEAVNPLPTGNQDPYSEHSSVDSWKRDGYSYVGGCPPNLNWHRDPQQAHPYTGGNIPPQHVGSWQSSPIHSPDGVWHRGGVVGGPYRPSGPHGGYPMEPYACYPQYSTVSGPFRPSSEPVLKPGAIPGGYYHPTNGEPYQHHQLPDSYYGPSHPVIPVRPGVYPHLVPYEGYYGPPPASFHSPTESDQSVRGMPNQFGVYERAKGNAIHDPEKFHVMPDRHASLMNKEQKEPSHPHETHPGQFKVLLKHHDSWEDKSDPQDKRVKSVLGSLPQLDRGVPPATSYDEEGQRTNHGKDDRIVYVNLRPGQEASSQWDDLDCCSRDPVIVNRLVNSSSETNDSLMTTPDNITSPPTKKNVPFVEKLEVLNNKARSSVGHSRADEKTNHSRAPTSTDHFTKVTSTGVAFDGFVSHDGNTNKIPLSDSFKSSDPPAPIVGKPGSAEMAEKTQSQIQKREHVLQGRTSHTKSRSDRRDTEWVNKSSESNNLVMANMANDQNVPGFLFDSHAPKGVADESLHAAVTNLNTTADITDHKAQRAKLKEIALRRAKELQEEEEERTREQKAKALAKLEELNRRTLAHASNQKKK